MEETAGRDYQACYQLINESLLLRRKTNTLPALGASTAYRSIRIYSCVYILVLDAYPFVKTCIADIWRLVRLVTGYGNISVANLRTINSFAVLAFASARRFIGSTKTFYSTIPCFPTVLSSKICGFYMCSVFQHLMCNSGGMPPYSSCNFLK